MLDTHPDIAVLYRNMIMQRSGEQRLRMGCSMFDTAKKIVRSAILDKNPNITEAQMKRQIFLRFYGQEFTCIEREKLFRHWSKSEHCV